MSQLTTPLAAPVPPAPSTTRRAGLFRRPGRQLAVALLLALVGGGAALAGTQAWALYHFRAGRADLERYHTPDAYRHLQACLRVWPEDRGTLLLAARAAARLEDFDAAEGYLDRARKVGGEDDALILERALLRAHQGDVDQVVKFCQARVEQHDPAAPLLLEALAHGYIRTFRLHEAELCVHRWLELRPDDVQALLTQAIIDEDRQSTAEALGCYRRVVEIDPDLDQARLRLADLLLDLAQPAEAGPQLEWLRKRRPEDPAVAVDLARCRGQLGQTAEAEQFLDAVLARDPHHPAALAERGKLALAVGDLTTAETCLRQACDRKPGDYGVHYQLAQCLSREGKQEEARKQEERLKQLEADVARIQAILTVEMGRTPHNPALQYEAGMILLRSGAGAEGLRWLERAVKEAPKYAPAHRALALYYEQAGQAGRAARHRALAELYGEKAAPDKDAAGPFRTAVPTEGASPEGK